MKTFILQIENDVIDIITDKRLEKYLQDKLNLMTKIIEVDDTNTLYAAKLEEDDKAPIMLFGSDPGPTWNPFRVARIPE